MQQSKGDKSDMSNNKIGNIIDVCALAKVYPEGQRISAVILTYDVEIEAESLSKDTYEVENRTIMEVFANSRPDTRGKENGNYVIIRLSKEDPEAVTLERRGERMDARMFFRDIEVKLKQKRDIKGVKGEICPAREETYIGYKLKQPLVDRFLQGEYEGEKYNLFIPENYNPDKKYPLVLFIEDAGVLGSDARIALAQGIGAVVWSRPEEQKRHECFVLAPQVAGPTITNDEFEATEELEVIKKLLDHVVKSYSIDEERIYGTGQSMGCMVTCELNVRYPELFAACLLVGGQWNPETMVKCVNKKFWITVAEGDEKAFPINNQVTDNLEKEGAKVGRYRWDAKKAPEELEKEVRKALKDECNIRYTVFEGNSVLPDEIDPHMPLPLQFHTNTWRVAYTIQGLRDWLLSETK
jgi:predicted peptidase